MAHQVPISFKDLAVWFSPEEWRLLREGQREFYRDVMRENYETLVSVGTAELLPLSAFLSPTEPRGAMVAESHTDEGQEAPVGDGPQGGQPQPSLHLSALVQLVKDIPEFLFGEVRSAEDGPESKAASLDWETASPKTAVAVDTHPPRGPLGCLPDSPASRPSLATTPTGSSSSSGPPGDGGQGSPLPTGTADKPQAMETEGPGAPGKEPQRPTCSPSRRKSHRRQERGTIGPGTSPGNSPLQGLINCLKEILVPEPQHPEAALPLLPSLPGLGTSRQTKVEVGPGSLPWPVKTEAASGDCPLQGLLNCLKELPEAQAKHPSSSGAGDPRLQGSPGAWKCNPGAPGCLPTPPPCPSPRAGGLPAEVKVEDGWARSPPEPAACQLGGQGHSPSSTGDTRGVQAPRWGPATQAGRASSSPLVALESCLKGIPPGRPSPPQLLAASWSQGAGDTRSQRPELQPQDSHSEEAAREPLLPLGLQGCMKEGPTKPPGHQSTPRSFSSASSTDGDLDFGSPGGSQGQWPGKGYPSGSSPLQGLENCLKEIPVPRPQPAWPCSSTVDRGPRRVEPRTWTAGKEGRRGEACEPARLRQSGAEAPARTLLLASPQTFASSCVPACHQPGFKDRGPTRPAPWRRLQDGTAAMPSPLHCLESSLRGILPVRPLRFACVAGPGPGPGPSPDPSPTPSPYSSSSLSSSDGEDPRLEPELWRPRFQEKERLPSGKPPVPLSPRTGESSRGSSSSCAGEDPERADPRACSGLGAGKAEGTGGGSQSPRREESAENMSQPGPLGSAPGRGGGTKGRLLPRDLPALPSKPPPTAAIPPLQPTTSPRPLCPCGRPLQQELHSLGATLEEKLDRLAAALAGLAQEVATMRTQVDRLGRCPRERGPRGQASWPWLLPQKPRWANGLGHRHLPYWRQKGPARPKPKILRAQAEGCRAGDLPGLCRGKARLLPPEISVVELSRSSCSPSQQLPSVPGRHAVLTGHPLLGHPGCHQSPLPTLVPPALPPPAASPANGADVEPLAAGVAPVRVPNQPKEPSSLLGGPLQGDLWGGEHRDPRWGAH